MAIALVNGANAPSALVVATPSTLITETTAATYIVNVNTTNLVAGDVLEVVVEIKPYTSASFFELYREPFAGPTITPLQQVVVPSVVEIKVSLLQTAGTGRSVPWSVWRQ
ncbi:MAG: hypothetical protein K0R61_146 [Microvirga sp.]|jgi:hypothetical protein|nr:hypothetical protein [Microvirga sp.]